MCSQLSTACRGAIRGLMPRAAHQGSQVVGSILTRLGLGAPGQVRCLAGRPSRAAWALRVLADSNVCSQATAARQIAVASAPSARSRGIVSETTSPIKGSRVVMLDTALLFQTGTAVPVSLLVLARI
ncbi:hypothetical protein GU90_16545 [Saccharopolyspora rectivirgula]|uniref:Uncharacterized protein n=1 Tax=Saccharopolyspora rectivirgula TaxID=28042 RepID=A0A073AWA2_9PSEU|nr:hypothetical protein GU90_16545 [Saccharopolyspora rectivirgula]